MMTRRKALRSWIPGFLAALGVSSAALPEQARGQVEIFAEQAPTGSYAIEFIVGTALPLAGQNDLEATTDGTWLNASLAGLNLDMTSIANWRNAYLEFSLVSPGTGGASGQVHLNTEQGVHTADFRIEEIQGYQTLQIPLVRFSATQAQFGNTLQKWMLGAPWAAGTLTVDEVKIVEGDHPADLDVFRESRPYGSYLLGMEVSNSKPFAGQMHLRALGADGTAWVNCTLGDTNIDAAILTAAWDTAGLNLTIDYGATQASWWEVEIGTDAGQWIHIYRNTPNPRGYQQYTLLLKDFHGARRDDNPVDGQPATAATFGSAITRIRIGGVWAADTAIDEIYFTARLNQAPVMALTAVPDTAEIGETVDFTATATDADGALIDYTWDFGDQSTVQSGPALTSTAHVFGAPGVYQVQVKATDDGGAFAIATVDVTVSCPSTPPSLTVDAIAVAGTVADASVTSILINGVSTPVDNAGAYQSAPVPLAAGNTPITLAKSAGDPVPVTLTFSRTP